ncbi:MAG: hypothetical protein AAFO75_01925 [Pseudomonadota bacterium]
MSCKTVLLLGNYRPTLTLARRLAPLGYRIAISRGGGEGGAEFSRYVDECWDHPPVSDATQFIAALKAHLLERPDILVVYPVWEACAELVARFKDDLPGDRVYATPDPATVLTCLDKTQMLEIAADADVPFAPFRIAKSYVELVSAADGLGFPLVLRPISTAKPLWGRKAVILRTKAEFDDLVLTWPEGQDRIIVQAYVNGPRVNAYFAAQRGKLIRLLSTDITRTNTIDGTGLAVEGRTIESDPILRGCVERLTNKLCYNGVGCVQFLRDPSSGQLVFLELNPRIAGNHAIAEASGLELSRLSISLATEHGSTEPLVIGAGGRKYAWTFADFGGIKSALSRRQISMGDAGYRVLRAFYTAVSSPVHMTWDWRDPLPTLALYSRQIGLPMSKMAPGAAQPTSAGATKPVRDKATTA